MRSILITLAVVAAGATAWAEVPPSIAEYSEIKIVNDSGPRDSVESASIYRIFVENGPKSYSASGLPRFAIVGKDRSFYFGIGGSVKATLSYDFGNPIDNPFDFTTSEIPMDQAPGNGGMVQVSAATSGLFFNFVALPGSANQIGAYIDFNLTGNNDYAFCLQYAYLRYRGITAGYNYSLFSDMGAAPQSIDNEGPNGFTAIPNGVVDYTYNFGKHWSIAAGLELPITSITTGRATTTVNQRVPDIPAYVQYAWGRNSNSWVRFSAILRNMQYRDLLEQKNYNRAGWGIKMSGTAALCPIVRAYYEAAYGHGMTSYYQDLYQGGLDMVPDAAAPGRLKTVKSWGGYIGLQYDLSPTVSANTTYSHVRTYADRYDGGSTPWGDQYKYAQYALANVLWSITPVVSTGIEYIYGRRVNYDGTSRHDNRIQTMLQVSF